METIKNYGFVPPKTIEPEEYVLGGRKITKDPIQPGGNWFEYLPSFESQQNDLFDTFNCTAYAILNALEILYKRQYGVENNWSERFVGVMAGTKPPGNSPHTVIEAIRKHGVIDDYLLPLEFVDSVEKYYSPDPMEKRYLEIGQRWLEDHDVKHEWVFKRAKLAKKQELLMEALEFSPLGVSVLAWMSNGAGLYIKPKGRQDTHWTTLIGYEKGKHWSIFDSYDGSIKKLAWNYDFGFAKRYHIQKRKQNQSWIQLLINYLCPIHAKTLKMT